MRSPDTHPEAHRFYIEMYRRMSPSRRFEIGVKSSEEIWEVAAMGIRSRHPDYDEEAVEWAIKRMRLGDDTVFRRVWPTAPLVRAMSALNTSRSVVSALEAAEIPFMIVGSGAAWVYGHNRPTYDFDVVIDPTHQSLDKFLEAFESTDMYIGPSPHQALDQRDMFNLIDPSSGWKIDLIVPKDRAFDRSQFERRRQDELMGLDVWVATAEDVPRTLSEFSR